MSLRPSSLRSAVAGLSFLIMPLLSFGQINKANNTDSLNLGTSWTGGVVPNSTQIAQWNNTVTGPNTTSLGGSLSWLGLTIANPNGLITINGTAGQTLTLGTSGINMGSATQNLTIAADVVAGGAQTWNINSGRTLNLDGSVSGAVGANITKSGLGTVILTGANSYLGSTSVTSGAMTLSGVNGALTTSGLSLSNGSTFTLANTSAANNTNRFSDTASITSNGGFIVFSNNAGAVNYSETIGALNLNSGSTILTTGQAAASQTSVLTFDSLNRTGSSIINFSGAGLGAADARNRVLFTNGPTLTNGIIGTWALYNNSGFAGYDAANGIILAATTDIAAQGPTSIIPNTPAANVRINSAGTTGSITLADPTVTTINTLTHVQNTAATINTAGKTLSVNAVMTGTGGNNLTIGTVANEGFLTTATPGGELLFINATGSTQTINAVIADNTSASSFIKMGTGAGITQLLGTNTYTGQTILREGYLRIRSSVLSGVSGPLGNATSAILIGDAGSPSGVQFGNNIYFEVQPIGDADALTISRDIDFSQTNAGLSRSRFRLMSNNTGGLDTSTLTLSGNITVAGTNRGGTEFMIDRVGQTINFTGNISGSGAIYLQGLNGSAAATDGASNGTFRFSNVARNFTSSIIATHANVVIDGVVGATGTDSPIGRQAIALSDGNGGNIIQTGGRYAMRSIFLENAGNSYARDMAPGGGSAVTTAAYGTGSTNLINGYRFGGLNTTGNVTFSGNITPQNVNVSVTGTAGGSAGTNPNAIVHNVALIAATGGSTTFSGVISGSTAPTLGAATGGAAAAGNNTRITINQFRNHTNLDENVDGIADPGVANALVGTATDGTVILTNANTYGGGTEVLGGTLLVNNTTGSGTGTGAFSNVIGSTLGGTGRLAPTGNNLISIAGNLAPGLNTLIGGIGSLTLAPTGGDVVFASTSTAAFQLATNGLHGYTVTYDGDGLISTLSGTYLGGGNDRLLFTGGSAANKLDFTAMGSAAFDVTFADGYVPVANDLFDLIDWTNSSGTGTLNNQASAMLGLSVSQLDLPTLSGNLAWDTSKWTSHGVIAVYNVIPEPSRALLVLMGMLAVIRRRRR